MKELPEQPWGQRERNAMEEEKGQEMKSASSSG